MIERLGKYQIVEQIGRGGMGAVYKANDPLLKRVVALKVISENVDESDELRARFFREAKACAQLSHPNIIKIYDLGEDAGRLFIVMEYLEGEDLRQVISQRRDLALESKLAFIEQICEALAYAHQKGIVHRDIKPGNVFISQNGVAKVLDFGLARIMSAKEDLTRTGPLMGTLRYMSPEQARGRVDQRSDMFAAASVFYELLAYHPPLPFDDPMAILEELRSAASPSRFRSDEAIPEDLGAVIERALRTDPDERFRDMTEMRKALDAVRDRLAQEAAGFRRRLEAQAAEVRELHARLVEEVGGEVAHETLPVPGGRAPVAALEASCREGEDKLARLRERVEQAGRLRPEYEQALDRMRRGQWAAAEETFEHLVREMPEHVGAQEGLTQARAEALRAGEVERERQAAAHAQQVMDEQKNRAAAAAKKDEEGAWTSAETTLLQRKPEPRDDVTVLERAASAELARPREFTAAIELPGPAEGVEARLMEPASPAAELPAATQSASPARLGRLHRLRGHRSVLVVSGLLAVACAVFFWIGTSRHLQTEVDRERKHVSAAREEAVKVEANRLASNLFDAAAGKDRAGEQQARDGRLGAAVETMRDAAVRYEEAGRAARVIGVERAKADEARALMVAAKERAARGTTEFKEALARESEGDSRYGELAFKEAAERFGAAARLFATVRPSAPAPSPVNVPVPPERPAAPDAAAEIREMLRLYARVFEAKDLGLLQQVRPGIRPEELLRYRNIFDRTRSYKLTLKVDAIKVSGDEAEARGRREDIVVTSNGETVRTPGEFRFRFKRSNNRWTIDAVR